MTMHSTHFENARQADELLFLSLDLSLITSRRGSGGQLVPMSFLSRIATMLKCLGMHK